MSEEEEKEETEEAPAKPSALKILLPAGISAIVLGGVAAGVAFVMSGPDEECVASDNSAAHAKMETKRYDEVAFVNLEPLVVSLGPNASSQYLKISVTLETNVSDQKQVEHFIPKFRDVLNTYLRAVDERDIAEPAAMIRLRAQMLRRIQLVAPTDAVQNILITDFVLN